MSINDNSKISAQRISLELNWLSVRLKTFNDVTCKCLIKCYYILNLFNIWNKPPSKKNAKSKV